MIITALWVPIYNLWVKSVLPSVLVNKVFTGTQSCPFAYILSMTAFTLLWQSWIVVAEIAQLATCVPGLAKLGAWIDTDPVTSCRSESKIQVLTGPHSPQGSRAVHFFLSYPASSDCQHCLICGGITPLQPLSLWPHCILFSHLYAPVCFFYKDTSLHLVPTWMVQNGFISQPITSATVLFSNKVTFIVSWF